MAKLHPGVFASFVVEDFQNITSFALRGAGQCPSKQKSQSSVVSISFDEANFLI